MPKIKKKTQNIGKYWQIQQTATKYGLIKFYQNKY